MHDKTYDITCDSDGWSCRSAGNLMGSFPSWLLAIGAARAAAEKDRRNGISAVIRYQDLKGAMQTLKYEDENMEQPPQCLDPKALRRIDRLVTGHRMN
ncbi:MAG: hypothetical protein JWM58_4508 [Rhizobium sp.]|nr:hypothetical protein [Rhizobium sp.]